MNSREKKESISSLYLSVRGLVRKWINNSEDAEDLVQEIVIKLMDNQEIEYKGSAAWLKTVTRNACMDLLRKRFRRSKYRDSSTYVATTDVYRYDDFPSVIPVDASAQPESRAMVSELKAVLSRIPEHQRFVLTMYGSGYSYEEIADITSTNVGTVRSRLHYGRQRLNKLTAVSS